MRIQGEFAVRKKIDHAALRLVAILRMAVAGTVGMIPAVRMQTGMRLVIRS